MLRMFILLASIVVLSMPASAQIGPPARDAGPNKTAPKLSKLKQVECTMRATLALESMGTSWIAKQVVGKDLVYQVEPCVSGVFAWQLSFDEDCGFAGAFGGDLDAACAFHQATFDYVCSLADGGGVMTVRPNGSCYDEEHYLRARCKDFRVLYRQSQSPRDTKIATSPKTKNEGELALDTSRRSTRLACAVR